MKKYEISQSATIIRQRISLEETQQTAHHIGSKSDRKKQDNLTSPEPTGLDHFSTGGKLLLKINKTNNFNLHAKCFQ